MHVLLMHTERTMRLLAAGFAIGGLTLGCARNDAERPVDVTANFEGPPAPPPRDPLRFTAAAYCRIVAQPGLTHWDRDLLTTCPDSRDVDDGASCTVAELVDGMPRDVDVPDVHLALRADGGQLVILHTNGTLAVRTASGTETQIAVWAAEPNVAPDGARVAFIGLGDNMTAPSEGLLEPGIATRVMTHDLRDGTKRVIADDAEASTPFLVPDSDDVVYVSSRSGLASIWRGNGEYEVQVTNAGLQSGDPGVLPTFGSRAVWMPGARTLAFEASTTESVVWTYDVLLGTLEPLGPGTWPQLGTDGALLAAHARSGTADCAVTYRSLNKP